MIGRIVGPYEVIASIGRGGMGEVFKARDQKLGRDVALKVLPPELAKDPDRLARFQREARVLASLQHQNIAAIYGLEDVDGQPVLAMELAAGEDLSTRLLRGPLPDNEIEKISSQLARGLEYAHEQGIVHRDLKPANVKVSGEGTVKILDFGLARAFTADSVSEGESESHSYQPTITQALTGSGTVLGTAAYMSPEQARGYEVDRRSDIWAFGVILYEMLTGERLFEGETATDTLAAVLHKEPDWEALSADHSPVLLHLCRRCLEKDQRQRLRDIGEVRVALDGSSSSIVGLSSAGLSEGKSQIGSKSGRLPWLLTGVMVLCLIGAVLAGLRGWLGPQPQPWPMVQSSVQLPESTVLSISPTTPGPPQVSPNGRYLAFVVTDSLGQNQVAVRNLAEGWSRLLAGTSGASYLFWSPDSREVGFFQTLGRLMRVPINGGPAIVITKAGNAKGGSWNQFDEVVYAPTHASSIMMVPAAGGEPVDVTHLAEDAGVRSHRLPQWLPDGRRFVYIAVLQSDQNPDQDCRVRITEAATGQTVDLQGAQASVQIAGGHLLYVSDSVLMARPLDLQALTFTGPPFPILQGVAVLGAAHLAAFSAVDRGVLSYVANSGGAVGGTLVRFDATGQELMSLKVPVRIVGFDIAPDGSRIATGGVDEGSGTVDLWQLDVARGLSTRLTFASESEWGAIYAPDGTWLVTLSDRRGHAGMYRVSSAGGGQMEPLLVGDDDNFPGSFSPDGRQLYYTGVDSLALSYIARLDLESGQSIRLHPGVVYGERDPNVAANGRWVAYSSSETGTREVFVERVSGGSGRWRVSTSGGNHPKWSPQCDVLYFVDGSNVLRAVPVSEANDVLTFGAEEFVLDRLVTGLAAPYDIDLSTGEILAQIRTIEGDSAPLKLVTGWQTLLVGEGKE